VENVSRWLTAIQARADAVIKVTQRLAPALLAKAFRGELVPQNPADVSADELLEPVIASRGTKPLPGPRRRQLKRAPRTPKETSVMTKSRQDVDVKGQPYLAGQLRKIGGASTAEALFKAAELPVADFYKQLAWEVAKGHVKDNHDTLEPSHAAG
jgi:type I restriction enzyme, S subunit